MSNIEYPMSNTQSIAGRESGGLRIKVLRQAQDDAKRQFWDAENA